MTTSMTRRQLLQAGGLTLGGLSLGPHALAQTPREGGTFVSARTTEATGLDPQLVPAFSRSARSPMMYNQLVRFEPDMTPTPELAESWEVSRDKLTWTFKLHQGVKFHDGQELTSADVKFTFDRLLDKSAGGKADFTAVEKVEPVGRYQVKFVTKEPFAALLAALAGFWGYIVSEAGVSKAGGDLNKTAMGTGPFMLVDWKVEQQMQFKKNPSYFKKGLPHVDEVIIRTIPDEANIAAGHRADEAVAASGRGLDEVLQAGPREGQEAPGRRGPPERLQREALGDPDLPHDGERRPGGGGQPEARRHHRRDRERRVRRVD